MTDVKLLREVIKKSGLPMTFIANKLGISREGLYKKMNNESEFKASEIRKMQKILHISNAERDKIFLSEKVN